ncbi:MAG: hypothetical protein ACR2KJ_05555 [Jatrophihabitans sp.]
MIAFLAVLLLIWLAFIVLGAVIKGLFWLLIIGVVLFIATGALGLRGNKNKRIRS